MTKQWWLSDDQGIYGSQMERVWSKSKWIQWDIVELSGMFTVNMSSTTQDIRTVSRSKRCSSIGSARRLNSSCKACNTSQMEFTRISSFEWLISHVVHMRKHVRCSKHLIRKSVASKIFTTTFWNNIARFILNLWPSFVLNCSAQLLLDDLVALECAGIYQLFNRVGQPAESQRDSYINQL